MHIYVCVCIYLYVTIISENRGHGTGKEQGYRRNWREKREGENIKK